MFIFMNYTLTTQHIEHYFAQKNIKITRACVTLGDNMSLLCMMSQWEAADLRPI